MKRTVAALAVVLLLLPGLVSADSTDIKGLLLEMAAIERNATLLNTALEEGRERATLCVHCHGVDGNSLREYIPNLAGQNSEYLFTQFEKFADGSRKDYVMSKLATGLTSNDRVAIAIYFSRQPVLPRQQPVATSEAGKQLYNSSCFVCHGQEGHGNAQYPRIAGQPYEYLNKTLLKFLHNEPERRNSPMMSIIQNMNEQQLKDVSAYIANLP